jgi:hypothetical protein
VVVFTSKDQNLNKAHGIEVEDGFVVLKGPKALKAETASIHAYLSAARQQLLKQGVLVDQGDFSFTSPSTAAGVVLGPSANGRIEWKSQDGRTLKVIQDAAELVSEQT